MKLHTHDANAISLGSTIYIRDLTSNDREVYTLTRPSEADIRLNRISTLSPIGKALYGQESGDVVEVEVPVQCFWSKLKPSSQCLTDSKGIPLTHEASMLTTESPSNRIDSTKVERAARLHLARTGYSRLSSVECSFRDGTIVLHGKVPSYYHKQLAQEALRHIRHVYQVVNNLEVFA